jgi:hypothetical protein
MSFINWWSMNFIIIIKNANSSPWRCLFKIGIFIDCQKSKTKKKKNTCFSHSLSSRMCCCLCASNEEILYFHLVVSISITVAASISSGRTRKRTQKFSYTYMCYSHRTKWILVLLFFLHRKFEIITMYMTMSSLRIELYCFVL